MSQKISDFIAEVNPEAIIVDGLEDALIGLAYRSGIAPVACYDKKVCINIIMQKHNLTYTDAKEWLEESIFNVYAGVYTPIFIQDMRTPFNT